MSENSKIEWTHHTFNPWWGCTKIGPGCDNCYAATFDHRLGGDHWGTGKPRREFKDKHWYEPHKWNREAGELGIRYRVFCASMADVFDNEVPDAWRYRLWNLIYATPNLDWLLLTKRIGNVRTMAPIEWIAARGQWPANVWMGATIVNQVEADRDIPKLLQIPARVRFLSMEPLLGPVSLRWLSAWPENAPARAMNPYNGGVTDHLDGLRRLSWVIVGGESGHNPRPMHPDWARALRDQCNAAGVPFFFKQWGEWIPAPPRGQREGFPYFNTALGNLGRPPAFFLDTDGTVHCFATAEKDFDTVVVKVGKKAAGRELDGRTWDEYPA